MRVNEYGDQDRTSRGKSEMKTVARTTKTCIRLVDRFRNLTVQRLGGVESVVSVLTKD